MDTKMVPEHYAVNVISEIMDEIQEELTKVLTLRENIKNNPKPDIHYLVMPEKLKCYSDGLKYCHSLLGKHKDMEKVTDE